MLVSFVGMELMPNCFCTGHLLHKLCRNSECAAKVNDYETVNAIKDREFSICSIDSYGIDVQ